MSAASVCAKVCMCKGACAPRFVYARITVYAYNRVHRYTQSMDTDECPKVNWITEQESERLLCLLDITPDLDKVLLALRSRLRGGELASSSSGRTTSSIMGMCRCQIPAQIPRYVVVFCLLGCVV